VGNEVGVPGSEEEVGLGGWGVGVAVEEAEQEVRKRVKSKK